MPLITAITPAPRHPGRFEVLVAGSTVGTLSLDAIERLGLAVGRDVDGLEVRIAAESARVKVYDRALNVLAFRARSATQLYQH